MQLLFEAYTHAITTVIKSMQIFGNRTQKRRMVRWIRGPLPCKLCPCCSLVMEQIISRNRPDINGSSGCCINNTGNQTTFFHPGCFKVYQTNRSIILGCLITTHTSHAPNSTVGSLWTPMECRGDAINPKPKNKWKCMALSMWRTTEHRLGPKPANEAVCNPLSKSFYHEATCVRILQP